MEKILISACLVGDKVRYDGHGNYSPKIKDLLQNYELVPFCGEVEGGLAVPRDKSERQKDRVISSKGKDVSKYFLKGAEAALNICKYLDIKIAILKDGSPSCGVHQIYDGTFNNRKIKGMGVLAETLSKNGIKVISEEEIDILL